MAVAAPTASGTPAACSSRPASVGPASWVAEVLAWSRPLPRASSPARSHRDQAGLQAAAMQPHDGDQREEELADLIAEP